MSYTDDILSISSWVEVSEKFGNGLSSTDATAIIFHLHKYGSICKLHTGIDQKVKGRTVGS